MNKTTLQLISYNGDLLVTFTDSLDHEGYLQGQGHKVLIVALVEQTLKVLGFIIELLLNIEFHFVRDET